MIGIPCAAMAMLSVYILVLYKKHGYKHLLILSGVLLALSLQTKLITVFLVPLILFYIVDFRIRKRITKKVLFAALLWLFTVFIIYVLIGFSYHALDYRYLVKAHTSQPIEPDIINYNSSAYLQFLFSHGKIVYS